MDDFDFHKIKAKGTLNKPKLSENSKYIIKPLINWKRQILHTTADANISK